MPAASYGSHPVRVSALVTARVEPVTPLMRRLVLIGDDLAHFESHAPDEHVKIVFPDVDGQVRPPRVVNDRLEWPRPFPDTREYTVRTFDRSAGELWIDFALHEQGLASDWVRGVAPGSPVWLAGPKPALVVPPDFSRVVMLGDHTALPAVARWLEELPVGTQSVVAVQIPQASERQELARDVQWLIGDDAEALGAVLAASELTSDGHTYLWAAGEAALLKPVRHWARANGFARGNCDIAGYWRRPTTSVRG